MKCLEKRPANRYQNFIELREDLESWAKGMGWSEIIPGAVSLESCQAGMTANEWVHRGYSLGQLGKNEESYQSYLRALDLNPKEPCVHTNIGSALSRLGRPDEALAYFKKETELHPEMALAWDTLAQFYASRNSPSEAVEASRRAFSLAPGHLAITRNYALIALRMGEQSGHARAVEAMKTLLDSPSARNNATVTMNEAIQFIQGGDPQTGLDFHLLSVQRFPQAALAWYNYGVTLHRARLLPQAVECYGKAIQMNPRFAPAWVFRGLIRGRQGDIEGGRQDWQAALLHDPDHLTARYVKVILDFNFSAKIQEQLDKLETPAMLRYFL
jgi:tetratricopeptide (TPR) repeat protein